MSATAPSPAPYPPPRPDADRSTLWGGLLIAVGVIFLFRQIVPIQISDIVWGGAMIAGGVFFLGAYRRDPATWALLIPGVALLVIGAGRVISSVAPRFGDAVSSGLLLGALGLAFLFTYQADRLERWWAVIPAGALLGLAAGRLVVGLGGGEQGWLFVGLGIAFLWLAVRAGRPWAFWPAGILLLMGLNAMHGFLGLGWGVGWPRVMGRWSGGIWPVALIAIGLWLLFKQGDRR
ncbi:MAG: hypothetical protein ABI780_10135 [Ardenticatenales bacterium]